MPTPEQIALIPALVGIVEAVKKLLPASVHGIVTIIVAILGGIVIFNVDLSNPIVAGAIFGLSAVGVITGLRNFGGASK